MVGLSEALSFPFVMGCFEVPVVIFRRFDELWQKLGLRAFVNASSFYLWPLVWSLHARAYHGCCHKNLGTSDQKVGARPIISQLTSLRPSPTGWRKYLRPVSSFGHITFRIS